jgi:AcrR family transcriptional regulator
MPPVTTRDAILDAAERLFARQGFAATTVKQIGAESGVNGALLYYYFADKETLYREMLARALGGLSSEAQVQIGAGVAPDEALRRFVRFQVEYLTARPHVARLFAREMVDHEAAHAEAGIARLAAGAFARLCEIVQEGQATGLFRADVDPRFAAISTVAQVVYMIIARPAAGILLGYGRGGAPIEVLRAFAEHAGDFAIAALGAHGARASEPEHPAAASATASAGGASAGVDP